MRVMFAVQEMKIDPLFMTDSFLVRCLICTISSSRYIFKLVVTVVVDVGLNDCLAS